MEQLTERMLVQKINITWLRKEWLVNPEQVLSFLRASILATSVSLWLMYIAI